MTDNNTISDARMTASSLHINIYYYQPYYGRLHETREYGGWCPQNKSDRTEYLQVDMGEVRSVCGVATQGLLRYPAWTTSYKLQLSTDGMALNTYKETNIEKVWREL